MLDELGDVIMCNRAWSAFAAANGALTLTGIGANYLAVCDAADEGDGRAPLPHFARSSPARARSSRSSTRAMRPERERWFLLRATRYHGPGAARVVVAHDDITARRQAEAEISTQAALLDEVDVAVIAMDEGGQVTRWNDAAKACSATAQSEAIGCQAAS